MECGNPALNLTISKQEFVSGSPPNPTIYMTVTVIRCLIGFRWPDGILIKNISCLPTAKWSYAESCVRMIAI